MRNYPMINTSETYEETFHDEVVKSHDVHTFEAGQEKTLRIMSQCLFRPSSFEMIEGDPNVFAIKSFRVGVHEQLATTTAPVPLVVLVNMPIALAIEVSMPGILISLTLANTSDRLQRIALKLKGKTLV